MSPQKSFWTVPHIMLAILGVVGLLLMPFAPEKGISFFACATIGLQFGNWLHRPHQRSLVEHQVVAAPRKSGLLLITFYIVAEVVFAFVFLLGAALDPRAVASMQVAFLVFCMVHDMESLYRARAQ